MLFLESPSLDPYFNLALEEHLFQTLDKQQELLMLWQNTNSIIVGRFQNTAEEINQSYVDEAQIKVARRLSGGGAVYHDIGNLNYTLLSSQTGMDSLNFLHFAQPVIQVLKKWGIQAEFNGRNDLLIDGKKFSGCAQFSNDGRLLYHGCILLHSNLDVLSAALRPRTAKFQSRGISSVASRVTTIQDHTNVPISMEAFKEALAHEIFSSSGKTVQRYRLSEQDMRAISELQKAKYATWKWNYGYYADYEMRSEQRFPWGSIEVHLNVQDGHIAEIRFFGDFFGNGDIHELEQRLVGLALRSDMEDALRAFHVPFFINGMTEKDLQDLLLYT
ncbi:MAG: lipoate--protein ligase [Oscillibacter sp.]|nr:lipoate--protein ligase [Oscillibacter sp.]